LVYQGSLECLGAGTCSLGIHWRFYLLPPDDLQEALQPEYAIGLSLFPHRAGPGFYFCVGERRWVAWCSGDRCF